MFTRREVILASLSAAAFRNDTLDLVERAVGKINTRIDAEDEDFWSQIQQAFTLDRNTVNFNNGGCSPSPRVVQEAMRRQLEFANQAPSNYMWRVLEPEVESVRQRLGGLFGVHPEEVAITRNASEALETLIYGIDLKPGDEILTTSLDYPRMVTTIDQRVRREGVKKVTAVVPTVPEKPEDLIKPIQEAITDRTKVMVVSHVSFLNGQIFPIKKLSKIAKEHGIAMIVDGAHSFVQFDFDQSDLDCDYFGTSLHKWLMAPIGTGMLYVKRDKIPGIWPMMAAQETQANDIRKFEEIGTHPAANHNAIAEAITFHEMIGMKRKEARLRYLRRRWTDRLRNESKVRFATNLNPAHSCALTTVAIDGIVPADLVNWLLTKHNIFTVGIDSNGVRGIRVSPNVYSTIHEVDRFAEAMLVAATKGIG